MWELSLFSPAKVNLFFRVLRKREDGYHEIRSLYQAIGLGDHLHFRRSNADRLTTNCLDLPVDDSNLIIKALKLFREKTNNHTPIHVHLDKKIPIQAGLGGGSSNAATTLFALNQLLKNNISEDTLRLWGAQLGSDVSFFFSSGCALCTGWGEKVQDLPCISHKLCSEVKQTVVLDKSKLFEGKVLRLDEMTDAAVHPEVCEKCRVPRKLTESLSIAYPSFGLSTELVFSKCIPNILSAKNPYANDLEPAAFGLKPELAKIKSNLLKSGFEHVVMTGSGTGFVCFGNPKTSKVQDELTLIETSFVSRKKGKWYLNDKSKIGYADGAENLR